MKRHRSYRRAHKKRRRGIKHSNWWPFLLLGGAILGVLAIAVLVIYFALPKAAELLDFDYKPPFIPETTPSPTPAPTPTPHPMTYFNSKENTQEVLLELSSEYRWLSDPFVYRGKMIVCAGKIDQTDKKVHLMQMCWFDPVALTAEPLPLSPQNSHFMFPKFNDKWLVYLDANIDGGGMLMAVDLTASTLKPVKIKDIYTGQPEPSLDGQYVAFTDRTGSKREKLFVCDLTTMESTVVEMFSGSVYGQSKPYLLGGRLIWADSATAEGDSDLSFINYIDLTSSTVTSYSPGTFVHDPKSSGVYTAWLSDVHGISTQLYFNKGLSGRPVLVDSGVVDFGMGSDFVAYSRGESIYVYLFQTGKIYRLTQDYEYAQLLGVSDNYVIWMDVTSRERDIVKFVAIP